MKTIILLIVASTLLFACKEETKDPQPVIHDTIPISEDTARMLKYPVSLKEIFKVHGGLDRWDQMNNLCFEMDSRSGTETHNISLPDRKTKIEAPYWSMGYNGKDVWIHENRENAYKGDPVFYHNLMFYFYAMPFVLADPGIEYHEVKSTQLDGEVYEGIKISYNDGVGTSPKDEYILYYHPETYQMTWLGYTVTYHDNEKSDTWKYIKYSEWQDVNGLMLPRTLTWYTVENGKPVQARNNIKFEKVTLTEMLLSPSVFKIPTEAKVLPN
ncbi:MAG: hypothetical protein DWP94_14325 [Flavobacterium sp.]|nr:MAG: hypothetical protein DWP94_14325 [Flavobacterium sp.]